MSTANFLPIQTKLSRVGTNVFTAMNQVVAETGAINLAQGFPGFACAEELVALVTHYMQKGVNQYAPMPGIMPLRERIAEKITFLYGHTVNPESEITITPGGQLAVMTVVAAVVNRGDEVIIFEPAFDCFAPTVELQGAVPVYVELAPPHFSIPWEEVRRKVNAKTRMIIINSPHNPTGAVLAESDMHSLTELVRDTRIIVLSDEVYEHIIFDGRTHHSIFRFPELAQRSFAVFSFGKVFHTTGWKIAYCVAPHDLMQEFRRVFQMICFCTNTPIQYALSDFLADRDRYLGLSSFYQEKRDYFLQLIAQSAFTFEPAMGTYFQLLRYDASTQLADTEAALRFARDLKVASIPISVFNHAGTDDRYLRFCFAKDKDTLEQAAHNLRRYVG